eukprot:SAG11_NODE_387_length_9883_cov_9.365699_14_plen_96_part_00
MMAAAAGGNAAPGASRTLPATLNPGSTLRHVGERTLQVLVPLERTQFLVTLMAQPTSRPPAPGHFQPNARTCVQESHGPSITFSVSVKPPDPWSW